MKQFLIFFVSMIIIILVVFVFSVRAEDDYKCMAELYPNETQEQNLLPLGGMVIESDNHQYRVMAECKHLVNNIWLQFMDTTNTLYGCGELDNIPDFVIKFELIDGEFYRMATYLFEDIMLQLYTYCEKNNISIKSWIHFAKPLQIPTGPKIKVKLY